MSDITHVAFARKSAQKVKRTFSKPKKFITALIVSLGIAGIGLSALATASNTITWTGQGATNGTLDTIQCSGDTPPGTMLWILTLGGKNTVSSATLTINTIQQHAGTKLGNEYHFYTGWFAPDPLVTYATATIVTGTLGSGKANLVISHGCPPATANVSLTKTFQIGPFTSPGQACFTLSPNNSTSLGQQCATGNNVYTWNGLTVHDGYVISESTIPAGYAAMTNITFDVRTNCSGDLNSCVVASSTTPPTLNFNRENTLLPGHIQVLKELGPTGATWTGPNVTFYICAHDPISDATALTSAGCNATTNTTTLTFPQNHATAVLSGDLAEGYYTVCENLVAGYTVDHQCQDTTVVAGSNANTANTLTFINTPSIAFWCSPGFWAQNYPNLVNTTYDITGQLGLLYGTIVGGAALKAGAPATPTIGDVLASPNVYGGPAFNSVADYLASHFNWSGTQLTGENCPINAHGVWTAGGTPIS